VRPEAELEASHSIVLREAGRLPEALEHEERRARLLASLGPSGAVGLAESMVRRGRILSDLARYAEARALLEEALAAQKALLGASHPDLAATLNPLSMACRRNGDLDCAVRAGEEALSVGVAALGPEALEVGYTLNHLGNVYAVRGEWQRAYETFVRVRAIGEKHLGEHHEVGMAHANLAWSLRWLRRFDEADAACARAEALVLTRLGPEHPYSLEIRRLRANLIRVRGSPQEAVTLQQRLLTDVEKAFGPDSELRAEVLSDLGVALFALGRRAEAEAALEQASRHQIGSTTTAETGEVKLALGAARGDCAMALEGRRALEAGGAAPIEWALATGFLEQCSRRP
jgi:tetratricopeptide (TPR) repeat protein